MDKLHVIQQRNNHRNARIMDTCTWVNDFAFIWLSHFCHDVFEASHCFTSHTPVFFSDVCARVCSGIVWHTSGIIGVFDKFGRLLELWGSSIH